MKIKTAITFALAMPITACSGISDCGEDGAACADMLTNNAAACAEAFQLKHSEKKRKYCEQAIRTAGEDQVVAAIPGLSGIVRAPHTSIPDDNHVEAAAKALGKIGDSSAEGALIDAIDYEAGTSSDPRDKMANRANEEIATALGKLGGEKSVDPLLMLIDKSRNNHVVLKAVRALGEIGSARSVKPIEEIALTHNNKFMRKNAVIALGNIGDPAATPTLVKMMFIEYQGVSFYREASFALFQLGPATTDLLLKTMELENEEVNAIFEKAGGLKESAIIAKCGFVLSDLRDERAVEPLIKAFKEASEKGDAVVLGYTAPPLGALADPRAVPPLAKQAETPDQSLRDPMLQALVMIGDRSAVKSMIPLMSNEDFLKKCMDLGNSKEACMSDGNAESRRGAQESAIDHTTNLASGEDMDAVKAVYESEPDEKVKAYLAKRMGRLEASAECKQDAGCWSKKLSDEDPLIRERAAWELKRLKDPSTIDALAKALSDKDRKTRYAAIYAYWAYGDERAVEPIEKTLEDEESSADFIRVNEDLKRLLVHLKRV